MNPEKKILMVGWGYPPNIEGGLDIHVYNLYRELRNEGFEVDLVVFEEYIPEDVEDVIPLESDSDEIVPKSRDISGQVAELAESYDIVHTHDWFGAEAGFKAKKYSNVEWVTTFHSLSSERSRGNLEELEKMERAAAEESDQVICVSEQLTEKVKEKFGVDSFTVHNGFSVPESREDDLKEKLGVEEDMLFYVGRHSEQKGVEHLLYGFKKYIEDSEDTADAVLVIGGEGPLTSSLEDFSEILGLEEKIIFEGFIPEEELGDYYRSSDLFISPSINEPFGLTITEALSMNTPVAATESGVMEIVPEEAYTLVEPDSESINKGIKEGLEENVPEIERRSWKDVARETAEIYRKDR